MKDGAWSAVMLCGALGLLLLQGAEKGARRGVKRESHHAGTSWSEAVRYGDKKAFQYEK